MPPSSNTSPLALPSCRYRRPPHAPRPKGLAPLPLLGYDGGCGLGNGARVATLHSSFHRGQSVAPILWIQSPPLASACTTAPSFILLSPLHLVLFHLSLLPSPLILFFSVDITSFLLLIFSPCCTVTVPTTTLSPSPCSSSLPLPVLTTSFDRTQKHCDQCH